MLGRVQGTLIQESDVSDVSESITGANIKPGPSHSSGLVWVDGSARYWQEESSLGAPLHCPAPLKIGQGDPRMIIGQGSGEGDSGIQGAAKRWIPPCWRARAAPVAWLTPLFQWMGGTPALLMSWSISPDPGEETAPFLLVTLP